MYTCIHIYVYVSIRHDGVCSSALLFSQKLATAALADFFKVQSLISADFFKKPEASCNHR